MTIIEKINSVYAQMTKSERAISAYLLSHPDELDSVSITDLAARNNVSTTTLIRFAKKLGYDGFREFKQSFSPYASSHPNLISKFEHIARLTNNKLLSDTISQGIACIENTFSKLSDEALDRAVSLLTDSRRVYTFGMKESYALANYAYTRLYTVRSDSFLLNVSNGDMEALLDITDEDTCMVFLFHRYTKKTLDVLAMLKKIGVSLILVTNEPIDEVEKLASVIIPCTVYSIGIKNTSIAPICLLDYLCNVMAINNPEKTLERFKSIEKLLEKQAALGS